MNNIMAVYIWRSTNAFTSLHEKAEDAFIWLSMQDELTDRDFCIIIDTETGEILDEGSEHFLPENILLDNTHYQRVDPYEIFPGFPEEDCFACYEYIGDEKPLAWYQYTDGVWYRLYCIDGKLSKIAEGSWI